MYMEWYVLSWNIYFFVYIYTYIVMYLVLRVGRALYDLFFAYFSESALTHEISSLKTTAARLKFKGIDGGLHKRWSMWFNSKQRAKPYQSLDYEKQGLLLDLFLLYRCCMAVVSSWCELLG